MLNQDKVTRSYEILDSMKLQNGLFVAAPSNDYAYVWMRDNVYVSLAYLNKSCGTYETMYHRWLDMFKEYEWKLDVHCTIKPVYPFEYIHARYSKDIKEIDVPWGHAQNDAVGGLLFGIGEGTKKGKAMIRDSHDLRIVQKLVQYLQTLEYWKCADSGAWEENMEVRSSSIAACVAGLRRLQDVVNVPQSLIDKGMAALYELFPYETPTRKSDLAQLSMISHTLQRFLNLIHHGFRSFPAKHLHAFLPSLHKVKDRQRLYYMQNVQLNSFIDSTQLDSSLQCLLG